MQKYSPHASDHHIPHYVYEKFLTIDIIKQIFLVEKTLIEKIYSGKLDIKKIYAPSIKTVDIETSALQSKIKQHSLQVDNIIYCDKFDNSERTFPILELFDKNFFIFITKIIHEKQIDDGSVRLGGFNASDKRNTSIALPLAMISRFGAREKRADVKNHLILFQISSFIAAYIKFFNIFHLNKDRLLLGWSSRIRKNVFGEDDLSEIIKYFIKTLGISDANSNIDNSPVLRFCIFRTGQDFGASAKLPITNDGIAFEDQCKEFLLSTGFSVSSTPRSADYGGDLVAEKDGVRWCIQCKDTQRPAGVSSVQQVTAAMSYYLCDFAAVISRNGYTQQALTLAEKLNVKALTFTSLHLLAR